jgi:hypothetical protein
MKKKILTIVVLLMFAITLSAQSTQSPWYGFGNSIKRVMQKQQEELAEALFANPNFAVPTTNMQFLFRPVITLTAFAIDFSNKPANLTSLTSAGLGLSYGKFSTEDAYCYYSVNALLLTEYKIGGAEGVKIGAAITFDAYNKLIGAGVGYINGHIMPLITLSHSF